MKLAKSGNVMDPFYDKDILTQSEKPKENKFIFSSVLHYRFI